MPKSSSSTWNSFLHDSEKLLETVKRLMTQSGKALFEASDAMLRFKDKQQARVFLLHGSCPKIDTINDPKFHEFLCNVEKLLAAFNEVKLAAGANDFETLDAFLLMEDEADAIQYLYKKRGAPEKSSPSQENEPENPKAEDLPPRDKPKKAQHPPRDKQKKAQHPPESQGAASSPKEQYRRKIPDNRDSKTLSGENVSGSKDRVALKRSLAEPNCRNTFDFRGATLIGNVLGPQMYSNLLVGDKAIGKAPTASKDRVESKKKIKYSPRRKMQSMYSAVKGCGSFATRYMMQLHMQQTPNDSSAFAGFSW